MKESERETERKRVETENVLHLLPTATVSKTFLHTVREKEEVLESCHSYRSHIAKKKRAKRKRLVRWPLTSGKVISSHKFCFFLREKEKPARNWRSETHVVLKQWPHKWFKLWNFPMHKCRSLIWARRLIWAWMAAFMKVRGRGSSHVRELISCFKNSSNFVPTRLGAFTKNELPCSLNLLQIFSVFCAHFLFDSLVELKTLKKQTSNIYIQKTTEKLIIKWNKN